MSLKRIFRSLNLLLIVSYLFAAGCGHSKPTGRLSGRVTFEGDPVADATIQVQSPSSGYADAAVINEDGEFHFSSPLLQGEYVASIMPTIEVHDPGSGTTIPPRKRPDIPERYRTGGTSGIRVDITSGENSLDIAMTKSK